MPQLKILMIVSSSKNNRCQYFPQDASQELINEIGEVSNRMKIVLFKGIIETNINKFTYQHFISQEINMENEEVEIPEHPVICICSDKSYPDNKLEKIFKEINEKINESGQKDTKISNELKKIIGNIFIKYQDSNNIKEINNKEIEFGVIEEFIGFDNQSVSGISYFSSDTLSTNDPKKRSRLRNIEKKKREEIENIKSWKKIKIIYLFISIILLMVTICSIFGFRDELFG
jgi:hypothetical protein